MSDTKPCEQCGESIPIVSAWGTRRFCGVACRNRALAMSRRRYQKRDCPVCHRRMDGARLTCSAACGYRFRKLRARKQKTCPICQSTFWPVKHGALWSKYCSKACYTAKQSERLAMVAVSCAYCARTFRRTRAAVKRVDNAFCNKVCASKFLSGENHPHWRGGHDPNRGPAWLKIAASIRERDNFTCRRCGRTQAENGQKLDVDHIVPWRQFKGRPDVANDPRNLVSLCKRCHCIKTSKFEKAYLVGDCCGMSAYELSISLPPLFEHYPGTGR